MRVWEFEDSKSMPSDLVREQDFILRLRRLQRVGAPHLVFNIVLNAFESVMKSRKTLESLHQKLQEFAKITNGFFAEMSNGDVFIIWEETADDTILATRILASLLLPDSIEKKEKILLTFHLPRDYASLRERANYYIEVVRANAHSTSTSNPADALKNSTTRGPLTAWSVDQIGKLIDDIDLRRYGRSQPIYVHQASQEWTPLLEEYSINFEDLRRECFPKLNVLGPDHLFLALCEMVDHRLLALLTEQSSSIAGRKTHLNLSVSTVIGSTFAQFARAIPQHQHAMIGFEINCGDLLQDFSHTLNAIELLHREGFKVALDGLTPDMLSYINVSAFHTDYIKINVSKEGGDSLFSPAARLSLTTIPVEKIVFYRCDNEKSLALGLECGVKYFQGWLIDDLASRHP